MGTIVHVDYGVSRCRIKVQLLYFYGRLCTNETQSEVVGTQGQTNEQS